jgi:hypothetical protein
MNDRQAKGRTRSGHSLRRIQGAAVGATYIARTNRWQAQIGINGRTIYLGTFPTCDAASAAYRAARSSINNGDGT